MGNPNFVGPTDSTVRILFRNQMEIKFNPDLLSETSDGELQQLNLESEVAEISSAFLCAIFIDLNPVNQILMKHGFVPHLRRSLP